MKSTASISTPHPLDPPPWTERQTLLELMLWDAIHIAAESRSTKSREPRRTNNLDASVTRTLLFPTAAVSNRTLLSILMSGRRDVLKGAEDSRQVRFYRKMGAERSLKIDRVRTWAVHLVDCGAISNSDAVRAWTWGLIYHSALQTLTQLQNSRQLGSYLTPSVLAGHGTQIVETAYKRLLTNIESYLTASNTSWLRGLKYSKQKQFLDFSASLMVEAMQVRRNPWDAHACLLTMYAEFDMFVF